MKKIAFILTLVVLSSYLAKGQTNSTDADAINHQLWLDFYPRIYLSDKLEYNGDLGYRTILQERDWSRLHMRPSVRYHINKTWQLRGGVGFFYIFNNSSTDRFEVTPWQGVQLNWPTFSAIKFKHLVRIEERFSFLTDDWSSSFDVRFRYRLSSRIDFARGLEGSFWFVPTYVELFIPVNDEIQELFRNRSRIGLGIGYNPSAVWRFSGIVHIQRSRFGPAEELKVTDYAYQLRVRFLWQAKH